MRFTRSKSHSPKEHKPAAPKPEEAAAPPLEKAPEKVPESKAWIQRRPERRRDYRILWDTVKSFQERFAQHNHDLNHEITTILESVVPPAR